MSGAVDIVVGGVITIIVTMGVEYFRRPSLELAIEAPPADFKNRVNCPARDSRHLRLILRNRPLPKFLHWMLRGAALQCRGEISFHHIDGQDIFGRRMAVRWASSPQPVASQITDLQGKPQYILQDSARTSIESRMDVYPGEEEIFDVAARFDDEPDCYGWNNDAYFFEWRNPYWKLERGRYLVKVKIVSSGQKCVGIFRLLNELSCNEFRLESSTTQDRATIREQ
jgi:hypothetical protein